MTQHKWNRRAFLEHILSGYSYLGLRSMLLGVSPAFLSHRLMANDQDRQFLIFSSEAQGSPLNCNVPGTYIAGVDHPDDPAMEPTNFNLGNVRVRAATPWSDLRSDLRGRMHFIHNQTEVNAHNEFSEVLYGLGRVKSETGSGAEMIASVVAQENHQNLGTIIDRPIVLDSTLDFKGNRVRPVTPDLFQALFSTTGNPQVTQMMKFRDQALDTLYADLRKEGTPAQKDFLNAAITSRSQARLLSEKLADALGTLPNNPDEAAVLVAAAICKAGAAPVVNIKMRFGSDNHSDQNLSDEVTETLASIEHLNKLQGHLVDFGVADQVTFALQNCFGRTLKRNRRGGRDHNSRHNVTLLFGPKIKPGVSGGIEVVQNERGAHAVAFNSQTGAPSGSGDIQPSMSFVSSIKTIYKACGLPDEIINKRVQGGKLINSVLV
mgnify:CR=1 FL=1